MSSKNFKCENCNKCYTSHKSLWNHNKKFHKNEATSDVKVKVGESRGMVGDKVGESRGEY
jgi:hypothetical protein